MIEILIPTYNRKNFLQKCIKSITSQKNYENFFKILVIDNCSYDGTDIFLKNLNIKNLKYIINNKNLGIDANITKCFKNCSEEYLLLLSDDDLLTNDSAKTLQKIFNQFDDISTISSPSFIFKGNKKNIINIFYNDKFSEKTNFLNEKNYSLKKLFLRATFMSGLIIKRANVDLKDINIHKNSYYPQLYVWGNAVCKGNNIFLKKPLVYGREENKKNWSYDKNYFNINVINIINHVCIKNSIHKKINKEIIFQRIFVSYNFLINEKRKSFFNFCKVYYYHFQLKEYRHSPLFHFYFLSILILGENFFYIGRLFKKILR